MGLREQSLERDVQRAVLDLLAAEHVFAIRLNTAAMKVDGRFFRSHSGGPGVGDIIAFPQISTVIKGGPAIPSWVPPARLRELVDWVLSLMRTKVPAILWVECKSATGKQSPEQVGFQTLVEAQGHFYIVARGSDDVLRWLKEHR